MARLVCLTVSHKARMLDMGKEPQEAQKAQEFNLLVPYVLLVVPFCTLRDKQKTQPGSTGGRYPYLQAGTLAKTTRSVYLLASLSE
jgi:hypothetical protein